MKKNLFRQPKITDDMPIPKINLDFNHIKKDWNIKNKLKTIQHALLRFLLIAILTIFVSLIILIFVNSFFENHYFEFQSPVLVQVQMPILIQKREKTLLSPGIPTLKLEVKEATTSAQPTKSTLAEVLHISERGVECVNNHPGVATKIKAVFGDEWQLAAELFCRESSLNPVALNPSSGACGLVQALPCKKLTRICPDMDIDCQLEWGKDYVAQRYGTIEIALAFHDKNNWY